jgi:hypothetical protein
VPARGRAGPEDHGSVLRSSSEAGRTRGGVGEPLREAVATAQPAFAALQDGRNRPRNGSSARGPARVRTHLTHLRNISDKHSVASRCDLAAGSSMSTCLSSAAAGACAIHRRTRPSDGRPVGGHRSGPTRQTDPGVQGTGHVKRPHATDGESCSERAAAGSHLRVDPSVCTDVSATPAPDDDQERRGRLLLLGKDGMSRDLLSSSAENPRRCVNRGA